MANLLKLLKWKARHNDCDLDYVQIAKYLNVDNRIAEEYIQYLHRKHYIKKWFDIKCPSCGHYTRTDETELKKGINCSYVDCDQTLDVQNLKYKYEIFYKINDEKVLGKKGGEQTVTQFKIREDNSYMAEEGSIKVFMSYSHEDEKYKEKLDKHLAVLKRNKKIKTWNDRKLVPGKDIDKEIGKSLVEADIIILLLSADFFASEYCYCTEMTKALELYEEGQNMIVPVVVRSCDWLGSPLAKLVALPKDGKAINKWEDEDEAYMDVVAGIKKVIEEIGE